MHCGCCRSGGFVSMEGEDEESDDEHSFSKAKVWKAIFGRGGRRCDEYDLGLSGAGDFGLPSIRDHQPDRQRLFRECLDTGQRFAGGRRDSRGQREALLYCR